MNAPDRIDDVHAAGEEVSAMMTMVKERSIESGFRTTILR